jgi:hypothetical protein
MPDSAPIALLTRRTSALEASEPNLGNCEACDQRCDAYPCTNANPQPIEIAATAAKE